jgi:hypothetical protein
MADAITDAMIEAGRHAWDCNMGADPKAVLCAIYLAMQAARQPPSQVPAEDVERLLTVIDERIARLPPEADRTVYAVGKHDGLIELREALRSQYNKVSKPL